MILLSQCFLLRQDGRSFERSSYKRQIGVQGKIKSDDYQDKDGNPRDSVCVMADEISLGPSNQKSKETKTNNADS